MASTFAFLVSSLAATAWERLGSQSPLDQATVAF